MSYSHSNVLWLCTSVLLVLAPVVQGNAAACEDTDTGACALLLQQKTDLCTDPALSSICQRFCGLCPLVCYDCPTPVPNPRDCVNTTSCSQDEVCIRKEHESPDGRVEYLMSCASKNMCEGIGFGFPSIPVGKRSAQERRDRLQTRNLAFKCCDVDLCNMPPVTTTTTLPPPTTPMPTTHAPTTLSTTAPTTLPLTACTNDLVFMVDGSNSVGISNHMFIVNFILDVVNGLRVGPRDTQVALVEFSNYATVEWYLKDHLSLQSLQGAVKSLPYAGGTTATHAAFWLVRNYVFTVAHGDRPGSPDVVVMVTDGGTDVPDMLKVEATALHGTGAKVIAIGVGNSANQSELALMASTTGEYFQLPNYNTLRYIVARLQQILCSH